MRSLSPYQRYGELSPVSDAHLVRHEFIEGETIDGLAHRYWGDRTLWRAIADRNRINDVRQIAPGTVLLIPEMPVERGMFESL